MNSGRRARIPDPRERPWLTVAELAEISGEGEKVIRAAIGAGTLPHLRIGRYVRLPTAALLRTIGLDLEPEAEVVDLQAMRDSTGPAA